MLKELFKNPRALVYAVLVHAVLLVLLVLSLKWNAKPVPLQGSGEIVQAVVIDEAMLQAEKERKHQAEQRKRDEEQAKRKAEEDQRQAELQKQRAEEQRQRESQQAAQKKQQQEVEQRRQAKLKAEKEVKERKHLEEQKRSAEQQAKRKIEEDRRKAEEAKRQADEAQRKQEEQHKADEARRQRENDDLLKQQLAQEDKERADLKRKRELDALLDRYVAVLQNRVTRNWIRPPTARAGMTCTVHVRLIPSGEVVEARTVKSSGDPAFDSSAEKALLRASPLPPPPDPTLRDFDFVFKPEG